jgi:hypothetical protein
VRLDGPTLIADRTRAHFLSASPTAHVAGHTASIALFADEAQEIDEEWFDRQFRPMAASTAAPTLLFGTPWDGTTLLDEAVTRNRERDASPDVEFRFHREVPWEMVAERLPAYGRFVLKERDRLGARNPIFRTQYGLEMVDSAGSFFSAEALAALEGTHERLREPIGHQRYVGGLDVAGDGARADASVLTVARVCAGRRAEVVELRAWKGVPVAVLESEAAAAARSWRLERLVVDATGMGLSLCAHLERELAPMPLERFVFTAQSKSELGFELVAATGRGSLSLFANDGSSDSLTCRSACAAAAQVLPGAACPAGAWQRARRLRRQPCARPPCRGGCGRTAPRHRSPPQLTTRHQATTSMLSRTSGAARKVLCTGHRPATRSRSSRCSSFSGPRKTIRRWRFSISAIPGLSHSLQSSA